VPAGTAGATTLLTNLANHVQPIIRYDLGDRVRFVAGECACGGSLPVIEVEGRADDVLTLDDAHGKAVHLAPLALTTVLEDEAGVFDFQLRRSGPRALQLDVYCGRDDDDVDAAPRAAAALRAFLRTQGLGTTRVNWHRDARSATRGRSGKQRRVVCAPASAA
jgi:phenylacetate-coenzyme A ligase PaaK-like adenylate-forming protein